MAAAAWPLALPWLASSPPAFVWVTQQPADLWDVPPANYLPNRVPSAFDVGKGAGPEMTRGFCWLAHGACADWAWPPGSLPLRARVPAPSPAGGVGRVLLCPERNLHKARYVCMCVYSFIPSLTHSLLPQAFAPLSLQRGAVGVALSRALWGAP